MKQLHRRDFLKMAFLTGITALLTGCDLASEETSLTEPDSDAEHILIVGAGMAGLAAAKNYANQGCVSPF